MKPKHRRKHKYHLPKIETEISLDDQETFAEAMDGVKPLERQKTASGNGGPPQDRELETLYPSDLMQEAVEELESLDWPYAPGYTEGGRLKWNRKLLRKLRKGRFAVQAELDLHGLRQEEAREQLQAFLRKCSLKGLSCVRVIHGKGYNSPDQKPVLKRRVPQWLTWKQNAQYVEAFTSAQPKDGGSGAVYVLLK